MGATPGRATPALAALAASKVSYAVHEYEAGAVSAAGAAVPGGGPVGRERDRRPHYGADTAAALGIDPARLFKTLVASVDGRLAVGIVPVAGELDLKALAAALGGRKAAMADPAEAERATGYVVGGISPLGQKRRLPAVLDASAMEFATILVSGGRRGLQAELAAADLVALTGARVAAIGREG